jgi:hypothetical protein
MENYTAINASVEMSSELPKTVDVSAEDKERFYKSILSDIPYDEVIFLFGDQLKVRFKALTVQENTDVVNQIIADKKNGISGEHDAYFITIATYRLGLSLVSVDEQPFSSVTKDNFSPSTENDTYVLSRSKLMRSWATPKLSAFLDAFQKFEAKLIKLTNEVQNPSFWKAST